MLKEFRRKAAYKLVWFGKAVQLNLSMFACIIQPDNPKDFLEHAMYEHDEVEIK